MQEHRVEATAIQLWQFRASMFPEKVRWALDYKSIAHVRRSLLPGVHVLTLPLRVGQKQVPVLRVGSRWVKSSDVALDELEARYPEPSLYPLDERLKSQALACRSYFNSVGVDSRRVFFSELLPATGYSADLFSAGFPDSIRRLYRTAFPLTRAIMKLDMRISQKRVGESLTRVAHALDHVAARTDRCGYLVGERFSVADLTAATVLNVLALPSEMPTEFPRPLPDRMMQWLERWRSHPATTWVCSMYRRHRGRSHAVADVSAWN